MFRREPKAADAAGPPAPEEGVLDDQEDRTRSAGVAFAVEVSDEDDESEGGAKQKKKKPRREEVSAKFVKHLMR